MGHYRLGNYLRTHRKRTGLSQDALAAALGLKDKTQLSRYERLEALPSLTTALGFETVYHIPVSELFAGVHETIREDIEDNLRGLETKLQQTSGKGPDAAATARVLEWLQERQIDHA